MSVADAPTSFRRLLLAAMNQHGALRAVPLSAAQRRTWMLTRMSGSYRPIVVGRYRVSAAVAPTDVQLRLGALTAEHEALRSVFVELGGKPACLVLPLTDVHVRVLDAPDEAEVRAVATAPFATRTGPLVRAILIRLPDGHTDLVLSGHRLVVDATALDLIATALLCGPQTPAANGTRALAVEQDPDAGMQRKALRLGGLLGRPAATEVRGYWPRPPVRGHRTESVRLSWPTVAFEELTEAEARAQVTAAWLALLHRRHGGGAAAAGVHLARRDDRRSIGPLDDMRVVRCDIGDATTSGDLRAAAAGVLDGDSVPFAHLLEVCPPQRDVSRTPYVQTSLRVLDARLPLARTAGSRVCRVPSEVPVTEHDLELVVFLTGDGLQVQADYDSDVLDGETVLDLLRCLQTLVEADDDTPVGLIDLGGDATSGTGVRTGVPEGSLPGAIQSVVDTSPDAVALRAGRVELTYEQLWRRAGLVAGALLRHGVRPGDRVAVWLPRGPEAVVALLGTWRAGAVYVPLDVHHPAERIRWQLEDCGATVVIAEPHRRAEVTTTVLALSDVDQSDAEAELPAPAGEHPAYLIYTSGSTGRPKGVVVRHGSVLNNVAWRQRRWPLAPADRVLHNHPFSFDPSIWAVCWSLVSGACIVLAGSHELDDPAALLKCLSGNGVTVVGGVPSLLTALVQHPLAEVCTKVRLVLSGGEALTDALVNLVHETWSATVVNLYGPTEATIDSLGYELPARIGARDTRPAPIGHPVDNTEVRVVDAELRPLPVGVPGEIVVSGAGLAIGYHDRPGLTATRFLPDPFGTAGSRLYRTGDLGRWLPGGAVQFLGRADHQVKIRGHRVELAEVESVLRGCAGVDEAVVLALDASTEAARLVAVVVPEHRAPDELRAELSRKLPDYLVPDRVQPLRELPLTGNGKIDRTALEDLFATAEAVDEVRTEPISELERSVAEAFAQVLKRARVGVHEDFFVLGGTSIMLAKLATLLSTRHDVEIPLHEFFAVPTAAAVAETIELYRAEGLAVVLGRQHAATLEADATLPETVRPDGLPKADWANPRRVLLTGATGYLGLHLLEELLRRTDAEVVCLCRGDDPEHALRRIREGLALYEIEAESELHRVTCVIGDLGAPRLGLTDEQWDDLARTTDVIYHNGALVNFVYPYSALKEPNVGGTQRVLELACTTRLKAVHHVSTIDTLLATHTPRPFIENDTPLRSAVGVPAGYTGSKWVAEKVVDVARRRGIPVTIFRPGLILGHTRTGATQTIDYLLVALRGFLPMHIVPDYPRIFDIVPVDYVASAIVHISRRPDALGGFFHLFNPDPVPLRTFCDWIADYGYDFDVVPFEEGRRRALQVEPGHPLYPLVPLIRDAEVEPHRALDPRFMDELQPANECARTLELLQGSGITCPPTSLADAHAVLDYLVRVGFLPRPEGVR